MTAKAEFREGWLSLVTSFIGMALSTPTLPLFGWGLFMRPVADSYGWTLAQVSAGLAAYTIAAGLASLPVGYLIDRYGAYRILSISVPVTSLAFAGLAFTGGWSPAYFALWIVIGVVGLGSGPIIWTRLLAGKFRAGRGLALGVASCGAAGFVLIVKPVVQWVIDLAGWQTGLILMGVLPLLVLYPLALWVMRPRHRESIDVSVHALEPEFGYTLRQVLTQWRFFIMLASAVLCAAVPGMLPHLEGALASHGISACRPSALTAAMGISLLIGRLLAGYLSDKFWSPGLFAGCLLLSGISAFCLGAVSDIVLLQVAILGIGAASGGEFQLLAYVTSRYFGVRAYGTIFGLLFGITTAVGGIWSLAISKMVDGGYGYRTALGMVFLVLTFNAAVLLFMGRAPQWKIISEKRV